jgi:hypothetical protein
VCYGRGSTATDHKAILQEVGSDRVVQEVATGKPILDVCPMTVNGQQYLTFLTGSDVLVYKWS